MALLDESDWDSQYNLIFSLWFERAECEFLSSNFDTAGQLIGELLQRGASKVDQADAYRLKVQLHEVKGEYAQAVASALTCLRLFGIDIPAHPTWEQVQAEYETVWRNLNGRPIESLLDLPLMTDPELQAAMRLLSILLNAAYYTNFQLFCFYLCRLVNISMQHGTSGASTHAYGWFGNILGAVFHRYREGYRLGRLACDLVEKHGFIAYQARVHLTMNTVAIWTQPIASALDSNRAAFRTATETGDLTYACYSMMHTIADLLVRNDPLDAVWRESERGLDFVRKARYRDIADTIVSQQRFIAAMQGRTATFSTFSDAQFDEAAFEAQLMGDRMTTMVCYYWILKLKARFLSGDYAEALAAADKAKALLWAAAGQIYLLDYFYYSALTVAALFEKGSADDQIGWRALLTAHREQLCEWAENYPPTFADKHALVSAEIARLEGRDPDAMRLYEQAIQSARENGFVQNEGLAHEVAARFYAAHGVETIGHAYLRNARNCYDRWGALGKVRQLDQRYPRLREESARSPPIATIGAPVEQLDVGTVVKASQAVSGEIELGKLIETLMRIAVEHAGAERGLLILFRSDEPRIEAEATTGRGKVEVAQRQAAVTQSELPESVLHYVIRTRESVILDDAAASTLFSADAYVQQRRPRSVLCLPLVKQAKLVGALYLENNLTPRAFTSGRIAVLELLASQAAISLEIAALYYDLRRSEAFLAEGQRMSHTGSWAWNISTGKLVWSEEHCRIFGFDPKKVEPTFQLFSKRLHAEDRSIVQQTLDEAIRERSGFSLEFRIVLPDGSSKYLHGVGRPVLKAAGDIDEYIGTTMDITERKRGEEALRNTQADLASAARLTTMGELAASIAHEINQPLGAMVANSDACLRWLANDRPNLDEARGAAESIIRDGHRAGDIIRSIRALARKSGPEMTQLDINDAIREVLILMRSELQDRHVSLETQLSGGLYPILGDRVQLQQVIVNLIMNGIEAMSAVMRQPRVLGVRSQIDGPDHVLIAVEDSGPGLAPEAMDRLFDPFFTTKPGGMGMGLSICRSIVDAHGGRLWASPQSPPGAVFQFTVPTAAKKVS
jgi:PAS domain S-box-containing protein